MEMDEIELYATRICNGTKELNIAEMVAALEKDEGKGKVSIEQKIELTKYMSLLQLAKISSKEEREVILKEVKRKKEKIIGSDRNER